MCFSTLSKRFLLSQSKEISATILGALCYARYYLSREEIAIGKRGYGRSFSHKVSWYPGILLSEKQFIQSFRLSARTALSDACQFVGDRCPGMMVRQYATTIYICDVCGEWYVRNLEEEHEQA